MSEFKKCVPSLAASLLSSTAGGGFVHPGSMSQQRILAHVSRTMAKQPTSTPAPHPAVAPTAPPLAPPATVAGGAPGYEPAMGAGDSGAVMGTVSLRDQSSSTGKRRYEVAQAAAQVVAGAFVRSTTAAEAMAAAARHGGDATPKLAFPRGGLSGDGGSGAIGAPLSVAQLLLLLQTLCVTMQRSSLSQVGLLHLYLSGREGLWYDPCRALGIIICLDPHTHIS